jgi:lipopolysaccharide transport system permease protein
VKSITAPLKTLYERRELIRELVWFELRDRHAGQLLGMAWAFGHPLALMLLYMVLFTYIFPSRYGTGGEGTNLSVNIVAGLVPWLTFQALLLRAPSIIVEHASLVKQIVFPIEVLPVKSTLASAIPFSVGLIFAIGYALWHGSLGLMALSIPLLVVFQLMAMIGVAFLLSTAGVIMRDLRDVVTVFCAFNLFAQPILYNPFATPDALQWVFVANPFSYLTWCWQDALFYGSFQHPIAWIVFPVLSVLTLISGVMGFYYARHYFGETL